MKGRRKRISVVLPGDVAEELWELAPKGRMSRPVVEAIREKLDRLREQGIREGTGEARAEKQPLDVEAPADIAEWLRDLRKSIKDRLGRLGDAEE